MSSFKIIGTIQIQPLVGAPLAEHSHPSEILQKAGLEAVQEAQNLVQAGFDAVILQNYGDSPYFSSQVPLETVSCMAIIAAAVREAIQAILGIEVLGNDPKSALAIASVTGCDFIVAHLKSIEGSVPLSEPGWAELLRERERLHSPVNLLTEIHSVPMLSQMFKQLSWADGVILDAHLWQGPEESAKIKVPLYLKLEDDETLASFLRIKPKVQGVILGSILRKKNEKAMGTPAVLDTKRMKEIVRELKGIQRKIKTPKRKEKAKGKAKGKVRKK